MQDYHIWLGTTATLTGASPGVRAVRRPSDQPLSPLPLVQEIIEGQEP